MTKMVDFFLPKKFSSSRALSDNNLSATAWRARLIIGTCIFLIPLTMAMFVLRITQQNSNPTSVYTLLLGSIYFIAILIFTKYKGWRPWIANLTLFIGLHIIFLRTLTTGGSSSPVIFWFAAFPIVALFFTTINWGLAIISLVSFYLAVLHFPGILGLNIDNTITTSAPISFFITLGALLASASLSFLYESERMNNVEKIRKSEQALAASVKLNSLGTMAAGVAHEINNPLAVISGNIQLIEHLLEKDQPPLDKIRERIKTIDRTTKSIAKITGGLQYFTRNVDSSKAQVYSINNVINNVVNYISIPLKNKHISLTHKIENELFAFCNPDDLKQTLFILIENSIDAVEPLEEKWIHLEAYANKNGLYITLTDSGSGIPEDIAECLMDPFFTTKEVGKGTGLGLSIAQELVSPFNATLSYNKDAKNTQFVIHFKELAQDGHEDAA